MYGSDKDMMSPNNKLCFVFVFFSFDQTDGFNIIFQCVTDILILWILNNVKQQAKE